MSEGKLNLRHDDALLLPLVEEAMEAYRPSAVAAGAELLSVFSPVTVRVQVEQWPHAHRISRSGGESLGAASQVLPVAC